MPLPEDVPAACVNDAVAQIAEDGALLPVNDLMRSWIAQVAARLDGLPLVDDELAELVRGAPVLMQEGERAWELSHHRVEDQRWLIARDVTDRERLRATVHAAARSRSLGELAASLAHDLNNQLSSALALCAELSLHAQDEADIQCIRDVENGTKIGAAALTALARMLTRTPARRDRVVISELLDESLSIVRKLFQQRCIGIDLVSSAQPLYVRVVVTDVVHAMLASLRALADLSPDSVQLEVDKRCIALADGRPRDYVVVRVLAREVARERAAAFAGVVELQPGSLHHVAAGSIASPEILDAALLQRRLGGDLMSRVDGDELTLEFCWPAAR